MIQQYEYSNPPKQIKPVNTEWICQNCGTMGHKEDIYCEHCGKLREVN